MTDQDADSLYREISALNNELVDSQRELTRLNAQYARALDDLRRKEEWLSASLRSIPDGILVCDEERRVALLNASAADLLAIPEGDVIGRPIDEVVHLVDSEGHPLGLLRDGNLAESVQREILVQDRIELQSWDGRRVRVAGALTPVRAIDGRDLGTVIVLRDVSGLLQAHYTTLGETRRLAAQSFAAGMAHELNNLLMVILANAQGVRSRIGGDGEVDQLMTNIATAGSRAEELIRRVMASSNASLERRVPVDLNEVVREVVGHFHRARQSVRLEVGLSKPLSRVHGDARALGEALTNLLDNAVETLEGNGWVRIETRQVAHHSLSPEGGEGGPNGVEVTVIDSGRGMSKEVAARAFEPFFTTKFLGRGLGLSVVYGIVESHGGVVSLTTEIGSGTTVSIVLPARDQPSE